MAVPLDTDPFLLQGGSVLSERSVRLHATCIRAFGKGLLLLGPSGSGKSDTALQLMAYGAELVADDQTILALQNDQIIASCPEELLGMIEARNMGLLKVNMAPRVAVSTLVDLSKTESERYPQHKSALLLGKHLTLFHKPATGSFPAALFQYLRSGQA